MKSNKLIALLAMTAALASCSQEEIITTDSNAVKVDLSMRPELGAVELGVGTDARMVIKDGSAINIAYETGDQVGAALIDEPDFTSSIAGTKTGYTGYSWNYDEYLANENKGTQQSPVYYTTAGLTGAEFYDEVEYISSNYPFTRDENGAWTSPANLVEGKYLFYMPYDAAHLNRKPIDVVLPQIQDCSDDVMVQTTWMGTEKVNSSSTVLDQFYKGTVPGFEKAPAVVGYKFLADPRDGSIIKPAVQMNEIFAVPLITIKNNFNGLFYEGTTNKSTAKAVATATIKIDSIQIYHADATDKLFYTAPIKSTALTTKLAKNDDWRKARLDAGAPTADILGTAGDPYENHVAVYTANPYYSITGYSATKQNHVTCVIDKELANGESYSFHAILPAANYGHNLKARVYATINGKRYIIADVTNAWNETTGSGSSTAVKNWKTTTAYADYTFVDNVNGGLDCELVRAEQFPKAEIKQDASGLKAFAGTMMTIDLNQVYNSTNKTYTGATAFLLQEPGVAPTDKGITSNEDLINYLTDYLQRGVTVQEVPALQTIDRNKWKTYNLNGVTPATGNIAFAENNTVIINAQLIKDLKNQTVVEGNNTTMLTLISNFPVAGDVKFEETSTGVYTFTTLDDDEVSFDINMAGVTFGPAPDGKYIAGINKITTAGDLVVKSATVANAAIVLDGVAATYKSTSTGISAIYVPAGATLNVEAACDALIISAGTINIKSNGSLTNTLNELAGTIENNSARAIAGTLATGTVVKATYSAAWPTVEIPANSKINSIVINTAVATTAQAPLAVEQAQIDIFKNLSNVNLTLGSNVTYICSTADVTLTNLKTVTATAASWFSTNNSGITVKAFKWGNANTDVTTLTGITAGTGVTLP